MRYICIIALLTLVSCQPKAEQAGNHKQNVDTQTVNTPTEEGFEMKQYYFVMLTKGARRHEITDTAVINQIQKGHLENIDHLAGLGKIVVAGPFGDDSTWRGIFIFDCTTQKEVEELLNTDPAIKAGRLAYEIHPWWTAKNCLFK